MLDLCRLHPAFGAPDTARGTIDSPMLRLSPSLVWLLVLSGAGCSDFKVTELEPRLSVTPQVVDFGAVPAGTEGIAQVGVVNSGAAPLTFVDPIITVDGLGSLTAVLDRPTLEPGDAGTLTLTYIPAGEESDAGTVLVGDTTGLREEVVWSGTGVVGWLQAAPSALDFGSLLVGESGVVGGHRAAVAEGTEIFGGIKALPSRMTE